MSEFTTPFRVGDVCKTPSGFDFKVLGIFAEWPDAPIMAIGLGLECSPMFFRKDGISAVTPGYDLIPPARPKLPDLPAGKEWHRPETITEEMIVAGWRPLILGEQLVDGDEFMAEIDNWISFPVPAEPVSPKLGPVRTKRPLPAFTKRVPLELGDIKPGVTRFRSKACPESFGFPISFRPQALLFGMTYIAGCGNPGVEDISFSELMKRYEFSEDGIDWRECSKEVSA